MDNGQNRLNLTNAEFIEVPDEEISDGDFDFTITPHLPPKFQEDNADFIEVLDMDNDVTSCPYKAEHGMEMLANMPGALKDGSEKSCKEAEQDGMASTVFVGGKMIACVGIIKQREGVGLAWALYPPDIGKYHIDPRIARNKLKELMEKHNLWRVEATVRADFPAGQSYLRYMGFEREGCMKKNEPDKTDSILYAIVR